MLRLLLANVVSRHNEVQELQEFRSCRMRRANLRTKNSIPGTYPVCFPVKTAELLSSSGLSCNIGKRL